MNNDKLGKSIIIAAVILGLSILLNSFIFDRYVYDYTDNSRIDKFTGRTWRSSPQPPYGGFYWKEMGVENN